jgi:aldehyde dehydrogenase (NAD+)
VQTFHSGLTRPLAWRRAQLLALGRLVQENEGALLDAMHVDLGKPRAETAIGDAGQVVFAVDRALAHLEEWNAPEKPDDIPEWRADWDTMIYKTPKGAVLLITYVSVRSALTVTTLTAASSRRPWNYPYLLTLACLVGAIAAGCTAVMKPSEAVPTTSALLADLIPKYLDSRAYAVVQGAVPETKRLLELRWDHIFYTGSTRVGKIVAAAAAAHLTPCTLELGSKSPVVIDPAVDLEVAARRILYGKQANGGQVRGAYKRVLLFLDLALSLGLRLSRLCPRPAVCARCARRRAEEGRRAVLA